jgi:hypothetical protein
VKWNHQIVATRRVKAVQQTVIEAPDDDEQPPDIQTMTVGSADDAKLAEQQEKAAKPEAAKPDQDKAKKDDQKKDQKKSN